jgi:tetratricopeptide (TPR) repeat protein
MYLILLLFREARKNMNEKGETEGTDKRVLIGLGICAAIGLLVVCLHVFVLVNPSKTIVALLWAISCVAIGHLIGFIFGIPRVKNGDASRPTPSAPSNPNSSSAAADEHGTYQVNTNLQDISDWLTKIIVGLGLVELRTVDTHLRQAAEFISTSLGGPETHAISGGIIVYFSTVGFLGGYITTRLFLGAAFVRADRALSEKEKREVENANINIDDASSNSTPKTKEAAEKIARIPWSSLKVTEVPTWAKAKLIVREIREAVEAYRFLVRANPNDLQFRLELCQALFENGERELALKHAKEALPLIDNSTHRDLVDRCYNALMFYSLFIQPDGYKEAIDFAARFQAIPGNQMTASMLVNLAAAYGQQASKDKSNFDSAKAKALEASTKAIDLGSIWKNKLKEMWQPAPDAEDNDLVAFQGDDDFKKLLS